MILKVLRGDKQRIKFLVFPEGIYVDKETKDYRTPKINSTFLYYFACLKRVLEENKKGKTESDLNFPASVVWGVRWNNLVNPPNSFKHLTSNDIDIDLNWFIPLYGDSIWVFLRTVLRPCYSKYSA